MPEAGEDADLAVSAPTAKTLNSRSVRSDPHDGQIALAGWVIER
jgi:hypothetical protein